MGKTAISLSIASDLEKQCILAASFFWDKNQPGTGLDSIKQFPSTIAHQLASFNEEFKLSLVKRLRQRGFELVQNLPLEKQMRALVVEPMGDLKNLLLSSKDRFIIILDGLDECGDQEALGTLMKLVLMLGALPSTFTVLVSSRPEPQVISAWVDAEGGGFNIPYEDVDEIGEETLHTVRCMVEEGLQDCVKKSAWKPSPEDFDTFASACRGLPVMASIRIRDVRTRTQRGSTLKREFEYLRNLRDAPLDLKSEYLRILRRAYMSDQSTIPSHVAENYRQVIGTIIAAYKPLSLNSMSQLLGIAEDELRATLEPIGSIVEFSSEKSRPLQSLMRVLRITPDAVYPKFYHATMKEFLTDHPFGHESDQPFFISDLEGHFLGPPLLRLVNDVIKRNKSKIRSFGDSKKRKELQEKQQPEHVQYAFRYLFYHLDPSRLSSQDSNEFSSEFDVFLTRNLLSFFMLSQFDFELPDELLRSNNHNLTEWFEEVNRVKDIIIENKLSPSHIFRSILPFTPSSSPLFKSYGHLSDPIRIFSITGEPSSHSIPLSGDTLSAQRAMEAKLSVLPIEVGGSGMDETDSIDRGAELLDPDIRNGIVTAAALSRDGRYIALGFGNGVIEVADIDHQHTVTRFQCDPPNLPAWIEFICGSHRIATEDNEGNIRVFSHGSPSVKIGTLPSGPCLPVTLVADNGSFIIRVPRNMDCHWCESMAILYVSDEPSIHPLSSPRSVASASMLAMPDRCTLGLSPEGQYVVVHDGNNIAIWSTETRELIQFRVSKSTLPVSYNTYPCPHLITKTRTTIPSHLENGIPRVQSLMAGRDADLLWLERLSCEPSLWLTLTSDMHQWHHVTRLDRFDDTDPFEPGGPRLTQTIWLNGTLELLLPPDYRPIILDKHRINSQKVWYGDRMVRDKYNLYLPCASKDGTRFLVQGRMRAPIVVDISQVV
ncbi:uncharacterized protein EI90DRAFT_2365051 [Cantharellus anzutake]|uniref:uncharacterized protein n=1 Tax=Cantharellus anzutake TaxID=1750568 RepID=UPI001905E9B6|nr:uncharacterized protein EI90DRAFT_2365051 [Cantharellus anzutake]KAF8324175.1 hypothetical protein EI90DRAFT_2365051 [Cantharellus anzutake]